MSVKVNMSEENVELEKITFKEAAKLLCKFKKGMYFQRSYKELSKFEKNIVDYLKVDLKSRDNDLLSSIYKYAEEEIESIDYLLNLELYLFKVDYIELFSIRDDFQLIDIFLTSRDEEALNLKDYDIRQNTIKLKREKADILADRLFENLKNLLSLMGLEGNYYYLELVEDIQNQKEVANSLGKRIEREKPYFFKANIIDKSYWDNWNDGKDISLEYI
jgi:hypothetical protein